MDHPDIHKYGLQDNCWDCLEHPDNPFSNLDAEMLSNLVLLTLDMRSRDGTMSPRTKTEAIARANVMNVLERSGKMFEAMQRTGNLDLVIDYYRQYWRIEIA